MTAMIEVAGLAKRFGPFTAVDHVSFSVEHGEVLGFLGPNGAGKSTTMKMITGFLTPSAGTARVCGHDVVAAPIPAKAALGYLPEGAPAYPDMTPIGFLRFCADVRGLKGGARSARIDDAVAKVELQDVLEQPIDTLSKGFKRRVGLAQAILHDPPVLILDEPTDGLDPNQKHEVRGLIRNMARDKAIIISTHILEEVDAVCSRALIIAKGRILADGTPAELEQRSIFHNAVLISTRQPDAEAALRGLPQVERIEVVEPGVYRLYPRSGQSIVAEVSDFVRARGWPVDRLAVDPGRLDEVFRTITRGPAREAA
jgi:ABC-2 type transport system ATP-binding protein